MGPSPRFVLVSGLSGAGKSQTLHFLEDLGYYCVDNLPASLISKIAELALASAVPRTRVAVCVDARAGDDVALLVQLAVEPQNAGERISVQNASSW